MQFGAGLAVIYLAWISVVTSGAALSKMVGTRSLTVFLVLMLLALSIGLQVGTKRKCKESTILNYSCFAFVVYAAVFHIFILHMSPNW